MANITRVTASGGFTEPATGSSTTIAPPGEGEGEGKGGSVVAREVTMMPDDLGGFGYHVNEDVGKAGGRKLGVKANKYAKRVNREYVQS